MTGLMRGDVQIFVDAPTIIVPLVKAGKIKAIAVSGRARDDELPETLTLAEAGLPAAETEAWTGLVAPARTPKSVIQRLNREIGVILKDADFRQRLAALSFVPVIASPEEFRRAIEADHQRWGTVIRNAGKGSGRIRVTACCRAMRRADRLSGSWQFSAVKAWQHG